jgi:hypothetical protein
MEATRVKIGLRSIVAILFDRYSGINDQNDQEAQKNAILKLYTDEEGMICLPASNIKASVREASSEIGNKTGSKQRRNAIRAGLFFSPDLVRIGGKKPDGTHAEIVTRKGTGGKVTRVVSYRPYLKAWECETEAVLYGLTPANVRQYMELAGVRYGLCGHRPEWGRFEVVKFEVIEG